MKLAVLSDLHLSTPDAACAFTWDEARLLRLLDQVEGEHDLVLLCGDVFDHHVGPSFPRRRRDLDAARRAWPALVARLEGAKFHWIHGNHDILTRERGVPEAWSLDADGVRVVAMHGHRFHPLYPWHEALKYPVKALASWGLRGPARPLGEALFAWNERVSQPSEGSDEPSQTTLGARAWLAAHPEVDLLVCGHDHKPQVERQASGQRYANSGTCAYGRLDWLSVDTARRAVEVRSGL
jgi:predicted phosphodiesterase